MHLSKVLLVAALSSGLSLAVVAARQHGYNEPCELYDETSTCDDKAGLMCVDTGVKGFRCKCPNNPQFSTIYDPKRSRCVGKVFNNCIRSSGNGNETFCTENADCNLSVYYFPICMCKKGFFETEKGTCSPVAKYGEHCDDEKQCDSKYGMDCIAGECKCKFGSGQFYDPKEVKCISYAGGNCSADTICIENAECTKTLVSRTLDSRSVIFSYSGKKGVEVVEKEIGLRCMCKNGFSQTKGGRCKNSFGSICTAKGNDSQKCNSEEFLDCLDGNDGQFRCQCRSPMNEIWDEKSRNCVGLIGRKCRVNGPKCEDRAECIEGTCQCANGTSLTPFQTCLLDFNQKCRPGQCNLHSGLTCLAETETCQCIDYYLEYDRSIKACVSPVGSPCGQFNLVGFHSFQRRDNLMNAVAEGPYIGCVNNSTCETKLIGRKMTNICVANSEVAYHLVKN